MEAEEITLVSSISTEIHEAQRRICVSFLARSIIKDRLKNSVSEEELFLFLETELGQMTILVTEHRIAPYVTNEMMYSLIESAFMKININDYHFPES